MWNDRRLIVTLLAATVGSVAFSGSTDAQSREAACRDYANHAVTAERTNLEKACGLAGPEWNGDFRYHYDWCMNGRNVDTTAGWKRWRDDQLAACIRRQPAQAPPVFLPSGPLARRSPWNAETIRQQILQRINQRTGALDARLRESLEQWRARRGQVGLTASVARLATSPTVGTLEERASQVLLGDRLPPRVMQGMALRPTIANVVVAPRADRIEPDSSLLVTGEHLGATPGRAYLFYRSDDWLQEDFQGDGAGTDHLVELLPFRQDWASSWSDRAIMLKLPTSLPGKYLHTDRPAVLIVAFASGARLQRTLTLSGGYPALLSADASGGLITCCTRTRDERWLQIAGTTSYVLWPTNMKTSGFGSPVRRYWIKPRETVTLRGRHFGTGGQLRTPGAETLRLNVESWTDTEIRAQALPAGAPSTFFELEPFQVEVRNDAGREALLGYFAFGPELSVRRVAGLHWLDAAARPLATVSDDGSSMVVVHAPACGSGNPREQGFDSFFREMPWPTDVKIVRFDFEQIDPENPFSDVEFFFEAMGDLALELLSGGPAGLLSWAADMVLDAIFGGDPGYHAYVVARPGGSHWSSENKVVAVDWETSCEWADGKPVVYATSFTVVGPEAALRRLR